MDAKLIQLSVSVCLMAAVADASVGAENTTDQFELIKKLDVPIAGGPVMATCEINGQEVRLVVDTYSAITTLTRSAAGKLKLKPKSILVTIASISERLEICERVSVDIGTVKCVPQNGIRVSDLMSNTIGPIKRDGTLGMDILNGFALWMDLGTTNASLARSLADAPSGDYLKLPLSFNRLGHPMVTITTGQGQMVECVLDSSAMAPIGFDSEPFDVLVERQDITRLPYQARIATAAQRLDVNGGTLSSCSFGELKVMKPKVFRIDRNFIGLWTLARFKTVIDFPAKSLYLKKGTYFEAADTSDRYGIEVSPENAVLRVNRVWEGTLPWKLGLRKGDEILSVRGHRVDKDDGWLASQSIGYFRAAPVALRLKRLNEEFVIELPASEKSSEDKR